MPKAPDQTPVPARKSVTIALLNMKGGVGKTTLAVNLAWHLCRRGRKKVLLIDLDPQFNASQYTMNYEEWVEHRDKHGTIADLLLEPQRPRMRVRGKPATPQIDKFIFEREQFASGGRLDVLPSELDLSRAIKAPVGIAYLLEKKLLGFRYKYDFVFIDCAPTDSVLTDTALMASDYVLTPVKPDRFSVLGYGQIQTMLEVFRDSYPDPHKVADLGVVFTQVTDNSTLEDDSMQVIEDQANYVFEAKIGQSKSYLRSVFQQAPVFDTRYAHQVTKGSLDALVIEMKGRIEEIGGTTI